MMTFRQYKLLWRKGGYLTDLNVHATRLLRTLKPHPHAHVLQAEAQGKGKGAAGNGKIA